MLPKRERITRGSEIKRILNKRQFYFSTPLLSIVAETSQDPFSRWVVVCPRRLGSAVIRNRFRRVINGGIANIRHKIGKNMNVVLMPKKALAKSSVYGETILGYFGCKDH